MDAVGHENNEKAAENTKELDDSSAPESVCGIMNEITGVCLLTGISVFLVLTACTCVVARQA